MDKYSANEKLASAKPISHKTKNLGQLRPDRPRNIITGHALKTKLKSSDAKQTLEAFIKDPKRPSNWGDASAVPKNDLITMRSFYVNEFWHISDDVVVT